MGKRGGGSQVTGYRYYFSILCGLARGPIDRLVEIKIGDIEAWPKIGSYPESSVEYVQQVFNPGAEVPPGGFADATGTAVVDNQRFAINQSNLFGGDKGEGGILGNALMLMGGAEQIVPDDVKTSIANGDVVGHNYNYDTAGVGHDQDQSGGTQQDVRYISDMRGVAALWYSGLVCANNPYPKTWKMRLQRAFAGWDKDGCWYPAKVRIPLQAGKVKAMNPAHILYQVLTDKTWGRGMDRSELDDASFAYAANRLWDEGFGLCLKWSRDQQIDAFIQTVIDHISAVMFVDRGTGLTILRLMRDDYDPATLPVFDYASGLLQVQSVETGSSQVMTNEIIVSYVDPYADRQRMTRVHNLASIQSQGAIVSEKTDYIGIADADLARRVALRDLRVKSTDLKKLKATFDRRAWKMQPGSVFKIVAPDKGIAQLIVRVATYEDGTATDGTIRMDLVQDVFGMPSTVFAEEPESTWRPPDSAQAAPTSRQYAYEATYYDMVRGLSPEQAAAVRPDEGGIIAVAGKPTANTLSALLAVRPEGGTTTTSGTGVFCPAGSLKTALGYYTATMQLTSGTDLGGVATGQTALIGDEIVVIRSMDLATGTFGIGRGAVDTIPQIHPAGTNIFFSDSTKSASTQPFAHGESVAIQVLPRTLNSILDPAAAPTSHVTIDGRHSKPYPPADLRINTRTALKVGAFLVSGDVVFTWKSRNKIIQADQVLSTEQDSVAPEAGTTYSIALYNGFDNTFLREHSGIDALTYTYNQAEHSSNGDPADVHFVISTVVNGVKSVAYTIAVAYLASGAGGYGKAYGFSYGVAQT